MSEEIIKELTKYVKKIDDLGIYLDPQAKPFLDKYGLKYQYNPELGDKLIFLSYRENPNYVLQMSEQMDNNRPFMGPKDTTNKYLFIQMDSSNNNTISRNNTFVNTNGQMRRQMGKRQIKICLENQDIDEILKRTRSNHKRTTTIYIDSELWAKFGNTLHKLLGTSDNRSKVLEDLIKVFIKRAVEQYPWLSGKKEEKDNSKK